MIGSIVFQEAVVVQVLDQAFDVYLPWLGVEKRIYMDKLVEGGLLENFQYDRTEKVLILEWKSRHRMITPDAGIVPTALPCAFMI